MNLSTSLRSTRRATLRDNEAACTVRLRESFGNFSRRSARSQHLPRGAFSRIQRSCFERRSLIRSAPIDTRIQRPMLPQIASIHAGLRVRVPLLCPSFETPLRSLNPCVKVVNVQQPRRVTGILKTDDRQVFPLHDLPQLCGRDGQVLARWFQAEQTPRRIVAPRHCLPAISLQRLADATERANFSASSDSLTDVTVGAFRTDGAVTWGETDAPTRGKVSALAFSPSPTRSESPSPTRGQSWGSPTKPLVGVSG